MAVCLVLGTLCRLTARSEGSTKKDGAGTYSESFWNPMITDSVNKKGIALKVDGTRQPLKPDAVYMNEDREIVLAVEYLSRVFSCASNIYDNEKLTLNKNTRKGEYRLEYKKNGEWYLPLQEAAADLGYRFLWDGGTNTAFLDNKYPKDGTIPKKYDYRKVRRRPEVKNQGRFGTCWALATMTALESSIRPEKTWKLSPDHLSNKSGFEGTQNDGGESMMSIAYLAAWKGPVLNEDDAYGDGYSPEGLNPVVHVQEAQMPEKKDFEAIKEAVYRYGGVQSSLYMAMANSFSQSEYYNRKNGAYCYPKERDPNHDVVIIGWDDTYPKENFNGGRKKDGAFICQNSWGSSFGEDGVFYISYEDANIGVHNAVYTSVENTDNYDHIYQSDLLGWAGQLGYEKDQAMFANVYKADSEQEIAAVGFYATDKNTRYKVYTVSDFKDRTSLRERKYSISGQFQNAGYYTVPLPKPVTVEKNSKFAVVVEIYTPGSVHPVAVEYASDRAMKSVDLTDGEGYISVNGKSWERAEERQKCNLCLKAYTVDP